jgi:hypothetical protein
MAAYDVTVKRVRGVNNDATALLVQQYIETQDSTTAALIDVSWIGDNNYVTCIITHNTTP